MSISLLHRKERLILTTIDIIDELGIQKLTTREIAKREGVSEATLFRHFENKNELLSAVLDYFVQFDMDIMQSIRMRKLKPVEALLFLVTSHAEYYENYPAITSLLQLTDVIRYEPELEGKIREIQSSRTSDLRQLIEEAIHEGEIREDADSEMLATVISGSFKELCLNWRLNHCGFSLRERAQVMLEMLLKVFYHKLKAKKE